DQVNGERRTKETARLGFGEDPFAISRRDLLRKVVEPRRRLDRSSGFGRLAGKGGRSGIAVREYDGSSGAAEQVNQTGDAWDRFPRHRTAGGGKFFDRLLERQTRRATETISDVNNDQRRASAKPPRAMESGALIGPAILLRDELQPLAFNHGLSPSFSAAPE